MAAVVAVVMVVVSLRTVLPGQPSGRLTFTIDTPAVGIGVETGTPVILNGVPVGRVDDLAIGRSGAAMTLDLDKNSVTGLRQNFGFDFRPQNYFGVSAVNIVDAGNDTQPILLSGARIWRPAGGDFTMGTMIDTGSEFVNGALLPPMMDAIRRSLDYSASLQPLVHTGVVVAETVEQTQRSMPDYLIDRYNDIAGALPPFTLGVIDAGFHVYNSELRPAGDDIQNRYAKALEAIANQFFTLVGTLLTSNRSNLESTVEIVKSAADLLPAMGEGVLTPVTLRTLISNLDGAFDPGPDGARTLKVKLDLDLLPVLQTPVVGLSAASESRPR
ncbi:MULTISPECIES: MlaD family protein [unclassified Nocardia]|uniref:MlaD family protein n=1 Tax=unclassified Nocardia TaxID=2637762 RepID=UPI00367DB986